MRTLALCQAWRDAGGVAMLASRCLSPPLAARFAREGISVHPVAAEPGGADDAAALRRLAETSEAKWAVLDGYGFPAGFADGFEDCGCKVLCIDDKGHLSRYPYAMVLNQNLHADEVSYRGTKEETKVLRGPAYALLRREFRRKAPPRTYPDRARCLLLMLGGSDPQNRTGRLIDALVAAKLPLAIDAVIGPANPRAAALCAQYADTADLRLHCDVADLTGLMTASDLALSSAGSVAWEMARFGLPMILGAVADVEELLGDRLSRAGGCLYSGLFANVPAAEIAQLAARLAADAGLRKRLGRKAAALIDGRGAERVVELMMQNRGRT